MNNAPTRQYPTQYTQPEPHVQSIQSEGAHHQQYYSPNGDFYRSEYSQPYTYPYAYPYPYSPSMRSAPTTATAPGTGYTSDNHFVYPSTAVYISKHDARAEQLEDVTSKLHYVTAVARKSAASLEVHKKQIQYVQSLNTRYVMENSQLKRSLQHSNRALQAKDLEIEELKEQCTKLKKEVAKYERPQSLDALVEAVEFEYELNAAESEQEKSSAPVLPSFRQLTSTLDRQRAIESQRHLAQGAHYAPTGTGPSLTFHEFTKPPRNNK